MRSVLLLLTTLLGFAPVAAQAGDIEFTLQPGDAQFSVLASGNGTARESRPFLQLSVERLNLEANRIYPRPQTVTQLRLGLAHATGETSWEVAIWGDPLPVGRLLYPGDSVELPPFYRLIPVDALPHLADYWLVVQVEVEEATRIAKVYAHSPRGVFTAPVEGQ